MGGFGSGGDCGRQGAGRSGLPSFTAQEKLRHLQQRLQDETPRRQEAELQELERLEAGLSWHGPGRAAQPPGCSGPPGSPDDPPRLRSLAPGGWGMGPRSGEGSTVTEQELQKVSAGLEELRCVGPRGGASRSWEATGDAAWQILEDRAYGVEPQRERRREGSGAMVPGGGCVWRSRCGAGGLDDGRYTH